MTKKPAKCIASSANLRGHKPAHWPQHLQYLNSSVYHSSLSPALLKHIKRCPISTQKIATPTSPRPKVTIRAISDPSHPANGQFGLFAAQRIPPKTHILDYIGEIHCDERPESDYDLSLCRLPDGLSVGIDASSMGNEARFINDYRGLSSKANSIFLDGRTPTAS
ncbi:hypothetical protein M413DRAFT_22874 [Hebeloma cylindrosporum]|uniref:SET domain-containing protein n=1 Tax=Hebeloma cylindrosporum TaxID=76867 RepID=A0A0C2YF01_HEBCY|nr:hypothetical protein M413DRAFT_22874 [Hebeloma cylindrosporum h7]